MPPNILFSHCGLVEWKVVWSSLEHDEGMDGDKIGEILCVGGDVLSEGDMEERVVEGMVWVWTENREEGRV